MKPLLIQRKAQDLFLAVIKQDFDPYAEQELFVVTD